MDAEPELSRSSIKRLAQVRSHTSHYPRPEPRSPDGIKSSVQDIGRDVLAIARPHLTWLAACVGFTIAVACIFLLMREPTYTSAAILQQALTSDTPGQTGGPTIDAGELVKTQMFRLQSAEFSRQAIDRMVKERAAGTSLASLYPTIFSDLKSDSQPTDQELDIANKRLQARLRVWNEARTYILVVSYSGTTPDEAARIVNLIVAEHEHTNNLQQIALQLGVAQNTVTKLASTLGPKHPQMMRAVADLGNVRSRMQAAEEAPLMQQRQLFETGEVLPARPTEIKSGVGKAIILLCALLISLLLALPIILLIEYKALEDVVLRYFKRQRVGDNGSIVFDRLETSRNGTRPPIRFTKLRPQSG